MSSSDRKPPRAGSKSGPSLKEERSSTPTTTRKTSAHQPNPNRDNDKSLEEAFARQLELATTELQKGKRNFLEKAGHAMPPSDHPPPGGSSSSSSSVSGIADPRSAKEHLDALTAQCRNVASLCASRHGNPDPNTTPTTTLAPLPSTSSSSTSFATAESEPDPRVPYNPRVVSILQRYSDPRQALPRLERALQPYLLVRGEKGDDALNDEMIRQYRHAISAMEDEIAHLHRVPPAGAAAAAAGAETRLRDLTLPISPKSWLARSMAGRRRSGGDVRRGGGAAGRARSAQ